MRIVILFGGSKHSAHTRALVNAFREGLRQEINVTEFSAIDLSARFCTGCGECDARRKCIYDDLDGLWESIAECDAIVIASPVYHLSFPAPLKAVFDRAQPFFRHPANQTSALGLRPAFLLAAAGSPHGNADIMERQLGFLLPDLGFALAETVTAGDTDRLGLREESLEKARELADIINARLS